jgi:pimeloyl-ACP methyl ester carboxylesterase
VTYAYRELGPKGGIPVIFFVHLAATLDNWDPRIIDPIAKDHHVITFDNRGVGASTGQVPDSVEAMADDAFTFVRALGFDQVDVFSFSLGGFVAQALVVKHPDLVRKLILTGTGPADGKDIDKVAGTTYWDMLRAALTRSDPKEFLFFNRNATGKPAARAFVNRLEERTVDREAKIAVKAFQTQLKAIKKWGRSAPADLSKITQPTLIANGDNDRMVPSVLSADLHRRIPGSELVIYPDSGHGGIFQYHDQFAPVARRVPRPLTAPSERRQERGYEARLGEEEALRLIDPAVDALRSAPPARHGLLEGPALEDHLSDSGDGGVPPDPSGGEQSRALAGHQRRRDSHPGQAPDRRHRRGHVHVRSLPAPGPQADQARVPG